jgi:hypothetical protein
VQHLFSNQYNWLLLYLKQPVAGKIRKLYLSPSETRAFLIKHFGTPTTKKGKEVFKIDEKREIIFSYDKFVIDKMTVLLTKNEPESEQQTNE